MSASNKFNFDSFIMINTRLLFLFLPFMFVLSFYIPYIALFKEIIVAITIFIIVATFAIKKKHSLNSYIFILFLFVVYGLLHVLISNLSLNISLDKFRLTYLYPIFFLFLHLYFLNFKKGLDYQEIKIERIFIVQSIVMTFFGLIQFLYGDSFLRWLYQGRLEDLHINLLGQQGIRLISLMVNPIIFGLFLAIGTVFILFNSKINKFFKYILTGLMGFCILFTFSRVAYVAFFLTLIFYLIFKKISVPKMILNSLVVILLGSFVFTGSLSGDNVISQRLDQTSINELKDNVRMDNWTHYLGLNLLNDSFSFIWGSGLGSSNSDSSIEDPRINRVENSYVSYLGETGFLGLLFIIFFICRFFSNALYLYKKQKIREANILVCIMLIILIGSFGNDLLHNNPFSFYFWAILFMSEEMKRLQMRNRHD
ncbi:O-antigen ligase family protein [Halalkalibacterium halodurans]|uniref:O-antigen ligase family protein n=1 Tax=Halalkalibacterium halodurans TaxID=86665 RepID=UPI002E1ACD28|nr:O-antigen ligase family protein [Halalkalibacterium halodurans]